MLSKFLGLGGGRFLAENPEAQFLSLNIYNYWSSESLDCSDTNDFNVQVENDFNLKLIH